MRLGSMATSYIIKQAGVDPIYQETAATRNRIALQSDLLSAWTLGIEERSLPHRRTCRPSATIRRPRASLTWISVQLLQVVG